MEMYKEKMFRDTFSPLGREPLDSHPALRDIT